MPCVEGWSFSLLKTSTPLKAAPRDAVARLGLCRFQRHYFLMLVSVRAVTSLYVDGYASAIRRATVRLPRRRAQLGEMAIAGHLA